MRKDGKKKKIDFNPCPSTIYVFFFPYDSSKLTIINESQVMNSRQEDEFERDADSDEYSDFRDESMSSDHSQPVDENISDSEGELEGFSSPSNHSDSSSSLDDLEDTPRHDLNVEDISILGDSTVSQSLVDDGNDDDIIETNQEDSSDEFTKKNLRSDEFLEESKEEISQSLLEMGRKLITDNDLQLAEELDYSDEEIGLGNARHVIRDNPRRYERYFSPNYARLYSKELHDFANGEPLMDLKFSSSFSRVSTQHEVNSLPFSQYHFGYRQNETGYSREIDSETALENGFVSGTFWTSDEKERFFVFLGRRSRHNMLGVSQGVRTKSVTECEEYYNILFRATEQQVRQACPADRARYGITMKDIPAAQEMSEEWIDMEERQAESMQFFEHRRLLHLIQYSTDKHQPKLFIRNTYKRQQVPVKWGNYRYPNEVDTADSLINLKMLIHLSNKLFTAAPYDNHFFSPERNRPKMDCFPLELIQELQDIVIDMTRTIIRHILANFVGVKMHIEIPDVLSSLLSLGYPVHSRTYWHNFPRRSGIILQDGIPATSYNSYYDEVEKRLPIYDRRKKLEYDSESIHYVNFASAAASYWKKPGPKYETEEAMNELKRKSTVLDKNVKKKWRKKFKGEFRRDPEDLSNIDESKISSSESEDDSEPSIELNTEEESSPDESLSSEAFSDLDVKDELDYSDKSEDQNLNESSVLGDGGIHTAFFSNDSQPMNSSDPSAEVSSSENSSNDSGKEFDINWQVDQPQSYFQETKLKIWRRVEMMHYKRRKNWKSMIRKDLRMMNIFL